MNKTTEALKLAEAALTINQQHIDLHTPEYVVTRKINKEALAAIREALAEPDWYEEAMRLGGLNAKHVGELKQLRAEPVKQSQLADASLEPVACVNGCDTSNGKCVDCPDAAPVDAKAIRVEALEEAAKVCDEIAVEADAMTKSKYVTDVGRMLHEGMWGGSSNCAAAIRSLK